MKDCSGSLVALWNAEISFYGVVKQKFKYSFTPSATTSATQRAARWQCRRQKATIGRKLNESIHYDGGRMENWQRPRWDTSRNRLEASSCPSRPQSWCYRVRQVTSTPTHLSLTLDRCQLQHWARRLGWEYQMTRNELTRPRLVSCGWDDCSGSSIDKWWPPTNGQKRELLLYLQVGFWQVSPWSPLDAASTLTGDDLAWDIFTSSSFLNDIRQVLRSLLSPCFHSSSLSKPPEMENPRPKRMLLQQLWSPSRFCRSQARSRAISHVTISVRRCSSPLASPSPSTSTQSLVPPGREGKKRTGEPADSIHHAIAISSVAEAKSLQSSRNFGTRRQGLT